MIKINYEPKTIDWEKLNKTFFGWIRNWQLKEACMLLSEPPYTKLFDYYITVFYDGTIVVTHLCELPNFFNTDAKSIALTDHFIDKKGNVIQW